MITLKISGRGTEIPTRFIEIENLVGRGVLYRRGTDPDWYVDLPSLERVHMALRPLGLIPGVSVEVVNREV